MTHFRVIGFLALFVTFSSKFYSYVFFKEMRYFINILSERGSVHFATNIYKGLLYSSQLRLFWVMRESVFRRGSDVLRTIPKNVHKIC